MKKNGLIFEPDLETIEEKIKDTIKDPFLKMQSFYKVYGNVNGDKINIEECVSSFPQYFKVFDEFLLWSLYAPITLHAIFGKFSFYLKNEQEYLEEINQSLILNVLFLINFLSNIFNFYRKITLF